MRITPYAMIILLSSFVGAHSQAVPTASQPLQISFFGVGTGTFTGLQGGRNAGITVGADFELRSRFSLYPSLETRGTYPVLGGQVDSQKNLLGGLKLTERFGNLHPYADILAGRGEITYENGGYPNPSGTYQYIKTPSLVISFGVGLEYEINDNFAVKGDIQFQHYETPVTGSGSLYAKPISVGAVYRLHLRHTGLRFR